MEAEKKYQTKTLPFRENEPSSNETYTIWRAILLALSIFYWCFYSLQYGPRQFTILENELSGFAYSKKAVIAFSYGYSTWNCMVFATTAVMLIYSIIWVSKTIELLLICRIFAIIFPETATIQFTSHMLLPDGNGM